MNARARLAALGIAFLCAAAPAHATFVIVNTDGPGEGFNDPTPAAPVGGNAGTTVGQQRLNVFIKAGQIWDAILQSPIPIRVQASFDPLSCSATSGVLGSAGANVLDSDFPGAPFAATWYSGAQANRLSGTDQDPVDDDIAAQFNSVVGTPTCLTTRFWYYGFDGNEGANGIDLLAVLLHEFGHGLGFLTTTDETNGLYFSGQPFIWDRFLMDDVSGKHWIDMTPAERIASAINTEHLVWDGPAVTNNAPRFLGKRAHVTTTGALTSDYTSGQGVFYAPLTTTGVTGQVVLGTDGVGTSTDGCTALTNAAAVAGKIVLLDRSATCAMPVQAQNAQLAGAIGVIIANNAAGPAPPLRGAAPTVTIPVTSITQAQGTTLKAAIAGGVIATLSLDPTKTAGVNANGKVFMYAPNPDQPGSSVSHYDVSAFPNLLMEPAINPDLTQLDLTVANFYDIGWLPQTTDVAGGETAALAFSHGPNPTREGGTLRFRLPAAQKVQLALFDTAGRRIARLADGVLPAGDHAIRWDRLDARGQRVAPGVYRARLEAGGTVRTLDVVLLD